MRGERSEMRERGRPQKVMPSAGCWSLRFCGVAMSLQRLKSVSAWPEVE